MWERSCAGCGVAGLRLCEQCVGTGRLISVTERIPWVRTALAAHDYDSGLGRALGQAKGKNDRMLAGLLARALVRRVCQDPSALAQLHTATLVSWVPSPWPRRLRRGFALSAILGQALARISATPWRRTLVLRPGARQATAGRHARSSNLRGRVRAVASRPLRGGVILVDDVVTTGATAQACARELLGSGAEHVHLLALCRAPKPGNRDGGHTARIL